MLWQLLSHLHVAHFFTIVVYVISCKKKRLLLLVLFVGDAWPLRSSNKANSPVGSGDGYTSSWPEYQSAAGIYWTYTGPQRLNTSRWARRRSASHVNKNNRSPFAKRRLKSFNQEQLLQLLVAGQRSAASYFSYSNFSLLWPPAQVTADSNKTAVSGKKASLSCSYALPEKVRQVVWRRTSEHGETTEVASFAQRSDPMIEPPYQGRAWLSASLSDSRLTIQPVAVQDEGCYTCLYSTHLDEHKSSTVCLATYGTVSTPWCRCCLEALHRNESVGILEGEKDQSKNVKNRRQI